MFQDFSLLQVLNWASVFFAFSASVFWFWSSSQRWPKILTSGWGGSGGSMQTLGDKLRRQSVLSACAAACAGMAALLQGIALMT